VQVQVQAAMHGPVGCRLSAVERRAVGGCGCAAQAGGTDNTLQPMWNAGLTGTGQVIQVGDTGVDQYHCLFHDTMARKCPEERRAQH
jgi:subtilisin family serine protease